MKNNRLLIILPAVITLTSFSWGKETPGIKDNVEMARVLIIGLNDNIKSNYYYDETIAEETGIPLDSINKQFNSIIAANIAAALPGNSCKFVIATDNNILREIAEQIKVTGEAENSVSTLSNLPTETFQKTLEQAQAGYLLVINQHYLKRQEKPMRTVFHIVSYTLYDKNKIEIFSGNQFFTSMKLENSDKMKQISRKSTSKIASSIIKTLNF